MPSQSQVLSMNSAAGETFGYLEPRLWTPPLRDLGTADRPNYEATYGWDVIDFAANVLQQPLDPWQQWVVVHAGELLEDGRPRFKTVLILVARQNGKTHLLKVLNLYWLFVEKHKMILGLSTNRDYAKEAWQAAIDMAMDVPWLAREIPYDGVRLANGSQTLTTVDKCKYKIGASNRKAGRSLTVNRLVIDELREHRNWEAWNASTPTTNAVRTSQIFCITNQGDADSVVLDSLRTPAIEFIETGKGDKRLGIFEYSSPDGSDPTDLDALAQANPNLGYRIDPDGLMGAAIRAARAGGEELASFQTEVMCQRVHLLDPAIEPTSWERAGTDEPLDLAAHRNHVALCVDIALDGSHAALVATAKLDGKIHCEVIETWEGFGCAKALRTDLPELVARVKPAVLGWFPAGPAAAVAADLRDRKTNKQWPPRGVKIQELDAELAPVCMGLAEQVKAGDIVHPKDPLLTQHIYSAQKLRRGDVFVFSRRGSGTIDAAYALAGAVHLARTMKSPRPDLTVL